MFSSFAERIEITPEPRTLSTCPQRYLSVHESFPIIPSATDRLREGFALSGLCPTAAEWSSAAVGRWWSVRWPLMPSLPHPARFVLSDPDRSWTFVTGASLLAGARNYCQFWAVGRHLK